MNYPVWELHWAGGGLLVALIAVFHVYIAHFAVGGGMFLVVTEHLGLRRNDQDILDYAKRHTRFFLLVTMVLGGVTGVGIWFIISLLSPAATTQLIHTFVFAWAIEWVFFLGEIVALLVYFYTFGKMSSGRHLTVGWLYFFFGWMSLFIINGVIGLMLTPGDWLQSKDFWDGFFNPTCWSSLAFRTFISLLFAGLYGFVTAAWEKNEKLRESMIRYCALWLLGPFVLLMASTWWYMQTLPPDLREMVLGANPELTHFSEAFLIISAVLFVGALVMAARLPAGIKRPVALLLLVIGLVYMGCFEWIREAARRPYLIYGYMYSNSILVGTEDQISATGYLSSTGWNHNREVTKDNIIDAGREIFRGQCSACHAIGGPLNDIRKFAGALDVEGMDAHIAGIGKIYPYMPRFLGTAQERAALAAYIVSIADAPKLAPAAPVSTAAVPVAPAPFDAARDEYILLAWTSLGLGMVSDCDARFSLQPPGSTLNALLLRRGPQPEVITSQVTLTYAAPDGFEHPSRHAEYWKFGPTLAGTTLVPDTSASGTGMSGTMMRQDKDTIFIARNIPVLPYSDDGSINPAPVFTLQAKDAAGTVLATTKVGVPVSTEIGCRTCHGGAWRHDATMGIAAETANDILKRHDHRHKTTLWHQAEQGKPVFCQSCHADPALRATGNAHLVNFSTAMHGFHANYLPNKKGAEACYACHPGGPNSQAAGLAGVHVRAGLDCTRCHGSMEDFALGLLKNEQLAGKPAAAKLMRHLKPRQAASLDDIAPRVPWIQEPQCLSCHPGFAKAEAAKASAVNNWTKDAASLFRHSADDAGLRCPACHGAPHAEYPAATPSSATDLQSLQYQGKPGPIGTDGNCAVCHTQDMDDELHHAHILGPR